MLSRIFRSKSFIIVKRIAWQSIERIDSIAVRICSSGRWLAGAYYFFLSRKFDREHLTVLKGRAAYYRSLRGIGRTSALLRRNIHRLEKGLIMRPRRSVFGEAFILETVSFYKKARQNPDYSAGELRWAGDVLDEYFLVVDETPAICRAREAYFGQSECMNEDDSENGLQCFKPYAMSECPRNSISFEEINTLFVRRRSVRWYQSKHVPSGLIQRAINAGALAPSACNRQPFRFVVADESPLATNIARCAGGTAGFSDQLPAVIVVIGDLSAYPKERDRHLIYIDSALASMQLMLAAETLGLSTCPINWPDVDHAEKELQKILNLPGYERVIMLIAIGYGDPNGGVPYSQKKHDSLITEILSSR